MSSKLMRRTPYEAEDPLEALLLQSSTDLQSQLAPPFQLTILSTEQYTRIIQALLYAILTQENQGQTHVTHLNAIVTDGYASFVHLITRLVNESYPRLLDQTKRQIIWVFRQLVELNATDAEILCLSLLRRIAGGDLTQPNLWLALELIYILQSNWSWVTANQGLLTGALFTYLRLLPDHCRSKGQFFSVLKKNEVEFCVRILRERFHDCICIGRDLIRLLQDVSCVPEFELIWKDLLANPGVFRVSGFVDISQVYLTRTPVRYLVSRVTPEMETQIRFMLTHVKWGNQRRYQAWFANKFFVAPESETLICDLIRFICCAHHPPNEILQSDIISRWAIIGWLLKCCRTNYVEANAKLALFYDWLFYTKTDNIMNIEPAILLMVHSIPKYIDITQSLLEFLFLLMDNYDVNRKELIRRGVSASFEILIGKSVIRSLEPLMSCNLIAHSLREKLASCFLATNCKIDRGIAEVIGKKTAEVATVDNRKSSVFGSQTLGQNSVSLLCHKGNNSHVIELRKKDSRDIRSDVAGIVQRKRMHANEEDSSVPKKRMCIDDSKKLSTNNLLETLKRSDGTAVDVLEKILIMFLGISEQAVDGLMGECSFPNVFQDTSPEIEADLAFQIANKFRVGGHVMFSPLMHAPDDLEKDEIMSATAVVLRIYTLYQHPKLKEILLLWHINGLAVGPRLLCYASRLADELEQIPGMKHITDGYSFNQSSKDGIACLDGVDAMEEEHGLTDISKDATNERKQKPLKQSLLKWHGEKYFLSASARKASSSCIQRTENVGMEQFCIMVKDAFRAYREFLTFTNTSVSMPSMLNSNQSKIVLTESSDGSSAQHELSLNQNMNAAFVKDLRTLCLWNVSRLQKVFRSIFLYLSDISTGKGGVIQLLVCFLVPAELLRFEIKLALREFSVFGEDPQTLCTLMKGSLDWDFTEQQFFWCLLMSELLSKVTLFLSLLTFCADTLDPSMHAGAICGLLMFLRSQSPSVELLNAILCLPKRFGKFVASIIASWFVSNLSALIPCISDWTNACLYGIQNKNEDCISTEKLNLAAIKEVIHFLDRHATNENVGSKSSKFSSVIEIRASLSKLVEKIVSRETVVTNKEVGT